MNFPHVFGSTQLMALHFADQIAIFVSRMHGIES